MVVDAAMGNRDSGSWAVDDDDRGGAELMTDPRTLPNDRFGYSVYALVSHASPEQVRLVAEVREAVGQARAVIPAHVTVRGTFYGIGSLDEMRGLLRQAAAGLEPTRVEFSTGGWKLHSDDGDRHGCVMPCVTSPALRSLHEAFDAVIRPLSLDGYGDGYRAHLTLCQDCTREQVQRAMALVADRDFGTGFGFDSVELMGRVGPAFGGEWTLIESLPLAPRAQ
jgi:2'-5' RNA ligase